MIAPPVPRRVRRRIDRAEPVHPAVVIAQRVLILLGLLAVVEAVERAQILPPTFIARPTRVFGRLGTLIADERFTDALRITASTVLLAIALAFIIGATSGYVLWRSRVLNDALAPGVAALFSSPIILLYPIPLVIFGRTGTAVVALAVVYGSLPIILYTVRAFREVPSVLIRVGEVDCLTRYQQLRMVILPAAAPTMFTGLRLGVTYVLITVVSMEFLVQLGGLGQQIQVSALRFDMSGVYAFISGVILVVILVVSALQYVERRLQR